MNRGNRRNSNRENLFPQRWLVFFLQNKISFCLQKKCFLLNEEVFATN